MAQARALHVSITYDGPHQTASGGPGRTNKIFEIITTSEKA